MAKHDRPDPNRKDRDPDRKSDKVVEDPRGNRVWNFAVESGRHLLESTSTLLRRLEVPGLKIDDEPHLGKKGGPAGGGYDPYGSNRPLKVKPESKPKVYVSRPTAPTPKPDPIPEPPASLLRRLFRRD